MKSARITSVDKLAGFVAVGVFVLGVATQTFAQSTQKGPPPGAGPPPDINPRREDIIRQTNQARLRSLDLKSSEEAENQKHILEAITNIKQDFARIQVLRNDIARNLIAHKPLDYGLITDQTGEISRRAHRLNVYMLAQSSEDKEQNNPSDGVKSEAMIDALVKLCKLIDSFTENPALKNAAAIQVKEIEKVKEDKARADRDLLAIIKLSESIHEKSDTLKAPR